MGKQYLKLFVFFCFLHSGHIYITTVLSTSLGKTFFVWRFFLNENILFWLTISYQTLFVFSVSVFCSQIFTVKLNLRSKIGLAYAISIVKWFFWDVLSKKIFFYFSLLTFNYWCFTTTLWKFQKKNEQAELVEILPPSYMSYPTDFCIICIPFYYGKSENIWFFLKTNGYNKTFYA